MPSVQFAHGTAFGTYYVDCEVIKKENDVFLIRFFDEILGDHAERWVERNSLYFPKFSDYGAL